MPVMHMNRFHPLYQAVSTDPCCRVDIERLLPKSPNELDPESLTDAFSEPPQFIERVAPVHAQMGTEVLRGKNWTDLTVKSYRVLGRMWHRVGKFCAQVQQSVYKERGMLPFSSICISPDMLHRILENDYENGENTYRSLMQLFAQGVIAPAVTLPFGLMLPLFESEFDRRIAIRMALRFYAPILEKYYRQVNAVHGESEFVVTFWLPEAGYCCSGVRALVDEFHAFCREHHYARPHLVLMLDTAQAPRRDIDILMKRWNVLAIEGLEESSVSVVFRDRPYSEWFSYNAPSVKKLIDRTIAKVDSALNAEDVNYCWAHYEDLGALHHSSKAAPNFEQNLMKLAQLGYLPLSPDVYVRRKLNGRFVRANCEPRPVKVRDMSSGADWGEGASSLGRWVGYYENGAGPRLRPSRSYVRLTRDGDIEETGSQCWKIAYNAMRRRVLEFVRGNEEKLEGGVLGLLRNLMPPKMSPRQAHARIEKFLVSYAQVYWREHFLQHDFAEAEIDLPALLVDSLFEGREEEPTKLELAIAGAAAQAYYFMLDAHKPADTSQPNFDQRAVYQNVMMLTLAICNLIYAWRWRKDESAEAAAFALLDEELLHFENAYERHDLKRYGVTLEEWRQTIASHVENSRLNIVARSARRTAARHLRPLGYRTQFAHTDEMITSNVGHIWEYETTNPNYRWENHYFCGVLEE